MKLLYKNSRTENIRTDADLSEIIKFDNSIDILSKKVGVGDKFEITAQDILANDGLKERLMALELAGYITFLGDEALPIEKLSPERITGTNKTFARVMPSALKESQEARFAKLLENPKAIK